MSAVKGHDMSHHWRLVSVEGGLVTGTFWVTRPSEKRRGQIYVYTVDVNIWDEDRGFGRCLTTKDAPEPVDPDSADRQCAWADYRKDYGVGESEMEAAHKAFMAGWKSAREGDQSGPLR